VNGGDGWLGGAYLAEHALERAIECAKRGDMVNAEENLRVIMMVLGFSKILK